MREREDEREREYERERKREGEMRPETRGRGKEKERGEGEGNFKVRIQRGEHDMLLHFLQSGNCCEQLLTRSRYQQRAHVLRIAATL